MAHVDKKLVKNVEQVNVSDLLRENLGVHFNFVPINEILKRFQEFLLDISYKSENRLTDTEIQFFNNRCNGFIHSVDQILKFNPSQQNAEHRNQLIQQITLEWQQAQNELRTTSNYLRLNSLDLSIYKEDSESLLVELKSSKEETEKLLVELRALPTKKESEYNSLFSDTQKRLEQQLINYKADLDAYTSKYESDIQGQRQEISAIHKKSTKDTQLLSEQVKKKILEVEQQVRKFSAKNALETYAQIFNNEANKTNKPTIRRWSIILFLLVLTEIATALSLFFYFLPEVMNIAEKWDDKAFRTGLIISIIFVKVFILSTIAALISYAIKNLNAQNHLYATNKFKANSLASFQAFIDATTDDKIIDQIIQQVSIAVYSQNISGYLSKDESSTNINQKDILDFTSKAIGKSS